MGPGSRPAEDAMKTIRNRSQRPIKIQMPGGKVLHLGPQRTGQISDQASRLPSFRRLVDSGDIEVVGEGEPAVSGADRPQVAHESTHGHTPPTVVLPKGNR
jgi:hypothetical protein